MAMSLHQSGSSQKIEIIPVILTVRFNNEEVLAKTLKNSKVKKGILRHQGDANSRK